MEYGLIGHPLGHSFSAEIHSQIGNYEYTTCDLIPSQVDRFLKNKYFKGINVTIPYKKTVIPYLDCISKEALAIGSVNTIINKNGKLYGYNTDILGFNDLITINSVDLKGKKVIILGSGGSGVMAEYYCKTIGASEIIIASRSKSESALSYNEILKFHTDADVIINTTPVGMFPDIILSPISLDNFIHLNSVVDIIYNPLRTHLSLSANNSGINSCNGLFMLVSQAVHSASLFFDDCTILNKIETIYKNILKSKRNIVFIGMPSSGKTTIGNIIADYMNFNFFDTDSEITKKTGKSVQQIFFDEGEDYFRTLETDTIKTIAVNTSSVISTGGGAVLNIQNINMLKHNGLIIFLDRSPQYLTLDTSRPLTKNKDDILKLYNQRIKLYREYSDITVNADGDIYETVNKLKVILNNENLYN